ncbi:hypothetical protein L7F22_020394 [Adiantum nelumboides]|nr:hypothetical protein [Adiantum nelumboides]
MEKHIAAMTDDEKERIVTVMKVMWHVVKRNSPLEEFVHQCNFHRFLRTPNMPVTSEYSAYTSKDAGKQFSQAIKDVYWDRLKKDIAASPFYSIQIDESTDISTQQYMIVYVTYMQDGGNVSITTCFMDLLPAKSSDAEALHDSLLGFLTKLELPLQKMIGIATDGASVMTGASNGVVSRLKRSIPHLLSFHCIAHRESLAAGDAFKTFKEFKFVDKVA